MFYLPILPAFAGLLFGILGAAWFPVAEILPALLALAAAGLRLAYRRPSRVAVFLVWLAVGLIRAGDVDERQAASSCAHEASALAGSQVVVVEIDNDTARIQSGPLAGCRVLLYPLPPGPAVVRGRIGPLRELNLPGLARATAIRRRLMGVGLRIAASSVVPLGPPPDGLRSRLTELAGAAPRAHELGVSGLLQALSTGRREALTADVREVFERSGTAHLLAISGLHVGLVAAGIWALVRFLSLSLLPLPLVHASRHLAAACAVLSSFAYGGLSGWSVSSRRAVFMVVVLVGMRARGHRLLGTNTLAGAATAVLLLDPWAVWSPGAQLSFHACGCLVLLRWARGSGTTSQPDIYRRLLARVFGSTLVSGWLLVAMGPLLSCHFGFVPVASLWTNPVLVPLIGWVVVPALLLGLVLSLLAPPVGAPLLGIAAVVADLSVHLAALLGAGPMPAFSRGLGAVVLWSGFCFLAAAGLRRQPWARVGGRTRQGSWCRGVFFLVALSAMTHRQIPSDSLSPYLDIFFLDVGQGDAILLRNESGQSLLVDAGRPDPRFVPLLVRTIRHLGVDDLWGLVLTHPDSDHAGGAPGLLEWVPARRLIIGTGTDATGPVAAAGALHRVSGGEVLTVARAGLELPMFGDALLDWLHPDSGSPEDPSTNDRSVVLRVSRFGIPVLLTGDISQDVERLLVANGAALSSGVLKVAHHGSRTSSLPSFLDAVDPSWAVISADPAGRFGHPHPEVEARLRRTGARVHVTGRDGTLQLRLSPEGLAWRVYRRLGPALGEDFGSLPTEQQRLITGLGGWGAWSGPAVSRFPPWH